MFDVHEMEVNFGPQHPSTHGVLRVILKIDGERIVDAKPIIGYLHRGTEKLFENMSYPMCIPHTDRMDYVASATNNLGFVETVEKLMGITKMIPRRAQAESRTTGLGAQTWSGRERPASASSTSASGAMRSGRCRMSRLYRSRRKNWGASA